METVIIRGVYKRNTMGRAYLLAYDRSKKRNLYRIDSNLDVRNGETLNVIGKLKNGRISVQKYYVCLFSRRLPKSAA